MPHTQCTDVSGVHMGLLAKWRTVRMSLASHTRNRLRCRIRVPFASVFSVMRSVLFSGIRLRMGMVAGRSWHTSSLEDGRSPFRLTDFSLKQNAICIQVRFTRSSLWLGFWFWFYLHFWWRISIELRCISLPIRFDSMNEIPLKGHAMTNTFGWFVMRYHLGCHLFRTKRWRWACDGVDDGRWWGPNLHLTRSMGKIMASTLHVSMHCQMETETEKATIAQRSWICCAWIFAFGISVYSPSQLYLFLVKSPKNSIFVRRTLGMAEIRLINSNSLWPLDDRKFGHATRRRYRRSLMLRFVH